MGAPHADQLISGYLARLKEETAGLPQANRRELLADVSSHVEEARRQLTDETDADILNILDRLGDPEFGIRNAAQRALRQMLPIAEKALRENRNNADAEIASRCLALLEILDQPKIECATTSGAIRTATMLTILIMGLIAGPAVSL